MSRNEVETEPRCSNLSVQLNAFVTKNCFREECIRYVAVPIHVKNMGMNYQARIIHGLNGDLNFKEKVGMERNLIAAYSANKGINSVSS